MRKEYILNPITNRHILVGGSTHKQLYKYYLSNRKYGGGLWQDIKDVNLWKLFKFFNKDSINRVSNENERNKTKYS